MWEEQEEEEGEDDDEEDEGLAGQLLSDLIASNKYGTNVSPVHQLLLCLHLSSHESVQTSELKEKPT